jgi:5-methylcytosine-specific restriction endonuclease McrA
VAGLADPADPARSHVEDGPAVSVSTAQMLACTAALSWMVHDRGGAVLALGRRRRKPNAAIRRAARERDHGRCRFPGCQSRRVDLHHIQHWINGGRTDLKNLVSLCPRHHMRVHDRGYLIAAQPGGTFAFCRPDGSPLPSSPALPPPEGGIEDTHDADITPDTIIPPWYGERLDLDHAIYVCFANARTRHEREQDADPADRGRATVYEPEDCEILARQYLDHAPRHTGPTLIPIQV